MNQINSFISSADFSQLSLSYSYSAVSVGPSSQVYKLFTSWKFHDVGNVYFDALGRYM
jgi:hypothetical protein